MLLENSCACDKLGTKHYHNKSRYFVAGLSVGRCPFDYAWVVNLIKSCTPRDRNNSQNVWLQRISLSAFQVTKEGRFWPIDLGTFQTF